MSSKNDQINLSPPRIVCAANRMFIYDNQGGHGEFIVAGARHHDAVMNSAIQALVGYDKDRIVKNEQGFIDQHGRFYTRKQAWDIAEANGQIIRRCGGDGADAHGLFSENLY